MCEAVFAAPSRHRRRTTSTGMAQATRAETSSARAGGTCSSARDGSSPPGARAGHARETSATRPRSRGARRACRRSRSRRSWAPSTRPPPSTRASGRRPPGSRRAGSASRALTVKDTRCRRSPCSSGRTATTSSTGAIASRSPARSDTPTSTHGRAQPDPYRLPTDATPREPGEPMTHLTHRLRDALASAAQAPRRGAGALPRRRPRTSVRLREPALQLTRLGTARS